MSVLKNLSIRFLIPAFALNVWAQGSWTIRFEPPAPSQGQTLRVEIDGAKPNSKLYLRFRNKIYAFYNLDDNKTSKRALIGIPADCAAGQYKIELEEKRFFLKRLLWEKTLVVSAREFPKENLELQKEKTDLTNDPKGQQGTLKIRQILKKPSSEQIWKETFNFPVEGRISSVYGIQRVINNDIPWSYHKGLDLAAAEGTLILAPNDGRVALVGEFPLQGRAVVLDHGQGVQTLYMHLSAILVKPKMKVKKGEALGRVGQTGIATAPHLHWGLYILGDPVDPAEWLKRSF